MLSEGCKFNRALLPENGIIIAAVSGGADSMLLLFLLREIKKEISDNNCFDIIAAHFNHGIRENAERDEVFVREYCRSNSIEFYCGHGDVPSFANAGGLSMETAARIMRFEYLEKLRSDYSKTSGRKALIATAHHADDDVETIVMNLIRGSGMKGLCGINEKSGNIIHPLLSYTKKEILWLAKENGIPFIHDETNDMLDATRNRIRLELIPLLESINPAVKRSLLRCSNIISSENEYIDSVINERYGQLFKTLRSAGGERIVSFPRAEAAAAPLAARRRIVRFAFGLLDIYKDVSFNDIERVADLFEGKTGQKAEVYYGIETNHSIDNAAWNEFIDESENLSSNCSKECGKSYQKSNAARICIYLNAETVDFIEKNFEGSDNIGEGDALGFIIKSKLSNEFLELKIPTGRIRARLIPCSRDKDSIDNAGYRIKGYLLEGKACDTDIGYMDESKLSEKLIVRYRKRGDTFFPVNAPGRKKLKDIFINSKIPAAQRDGIPLIESDGEIVFVPGIRCSECVRVDKDTVCIIEMEFIPC